MKLVRPWTEEEDDRLRSHIERGGSAVRAAIMFKRSQQAVRSRARELGLRFPTIAQLRKRSLGITEQAGD
jgi:hypothetical protein